MICPHCAFPNNPGERFCKKCKRPLAQQAAGDPAGTGGPAEPAPVPGPAAAVPLPPAHDDLPTPSEDDLPTAARPTAGILERVSACLAEARKKEQSGDLRGAFLSCQSLLIDMYGDIPPKALASLYTYMGKISELQGKSERADKYLRKAGSLTGKPPAAARPPKTSAAPSSSIEKAISMAVADAAAEQQEHARSRPVAPPAPARQPVPPPAPPKEVEQPVAVAEAEQPATAAEVGQPAAVEVVDTPVPTEEGRAVLVAGFWTRLAAFAIDSLVVAAVVVIMMVLSSVLQGNDAAGAFLFFAQKLSLVVVALLIYIGFLLVYLTLFSSYGGQSAGKMLMRIRVIGLDGHSLSTTRALRRAGGMLLAALPGLAGFLWAAFDLERRGWHDYIGGTLVVRLFPQGPDARTRT